MENLQYPIGRLAFDKDVTPEKRSAWIREVAALPAQLRAAVAGLTPAQLDTPYRDGGWTVRQVVHHLADSHLHAFSRFKFALTEETPTIKAYDQDSWSKTADVLKVDVGPSLSLIDGLHARLAALLASLRPEDFARGFQHPERGFVTLDRNLQMYAWHGRHHVAHITGLVARKGWR
jgi:hypothetical protein